MPSTFLGAVPTVLIELRLFFVVAVKIILCDTVTGMNITGEEIELRYTVKSYGIPIELVPVTNTGTIKTTYWKQWIRLRNTLDDIKSKQQIINGVDGENNGGANNNFPIIIECPGSTDVIFRTGTTLICHPGNAMFQNLMESKQYEHSIASQAGKMAVIRSIIDEVKNRGGR